MVKLVAITKPLVEEADLTPEEFITYVARVSNPSNQLSKDTRLVNYLIRHKHWSPFEHVFLTFEIVTTRGISAQILRHRSFTFQELCISGDSLVKLWYPESKNSKQVKIEDLYKRYNSSYWNRSGVTPKAKVYDEESRSFISVDIKEVFQTGIKPVYLLTLSNGKKIKATKDHKFLTKEGFKRLEDINPGDFVGTNGVNLYQDKEWLKKAKEESITRNGVQYIADKAGVSYHTIRKWLKIHKLQFSRKEAAQYTQIWNKGLPAELQPLFGKTHSAETRRKQRASSRKGADSNLFTGAKVSWRKSIANECVKYKADLAEKQGIPLSEIDKYEVDHILPVYSHPELAFDFNNLQLLPIDEHDKKSRKEHLESLYTAKYCPVESIEFVGEEMTYDLEVDHYSHNYVANGIVTHNSQRYSNDMRVTTPELRMQASKNRQGSDGPPINPEGFVERIEAHLSKGLELYNEAIGMGIAKETIRGILPLSTETTLYMSGSLRSFIHYMQLRCEPETQKEHREIAEAIKAIIAEQFKVLTEALNE